MTTGLGIHCHFYQPPRENPWTETIDREPGAAPWPNWNARILAECYRPNAFARIVDGYGRVERIVNNYAHVSFDFGPTLLSWLERADPVTYARVLEADRRSVERRGHGNAIAQAYHHTILPLDTPRDRATQVRWGLADFRHRFGREAEALWLPETACNAEVLELLIETGLRFVILSPHQAWRVRPAEGGPWREVAGGGIDTAQPYRFAHRDGSGRAIAVFFYDGAVARAIAFEGALATSDAFINRFQQAGAGDGGLVHAATDGESYGHHFKFGDRTLAHALEVAAEARGFAVTNYGAFLEAHPPAMEVELLPGPDGEGTSWSCAHGVGRWYRDCGCRTGGRESWNQAWRTPLRQAFDHLRDAAAAVYAEQASELFEDPWAARDDYIHVLLDPEGQTDAFFHRHAGRELAPADREHALTLLELQRHAMMMFTSCGWFFNDISGIETLQTLRYAGRVMDLMAEAEVEPPRERFLEILAGARSNVPGLGDGAEVYRRLAEPARVTPRGMAAHLAIASLVDEAPEAGELAGYRYTWSKARREARERIHLTTGRIVLERRATGRRHDFAVLAMHFGGMDFYAAVKAYPGTHRFRAATGRLWTAFPGASLPALLRTAEREFGPDEYGLEHVLPEGRRRIAAAQFGDLVRRFSEAYARLYQDHRHSIETFQEIGYELPSELRAAAEFTLGQRFTEEIRRQQHSQDPAAYQEAVEIAEEVARHGYHIDQREAQHLFQGLIADVVALALETDGEHARTAVELVELGRRLGLEPDLERSQELVYDALQTRAGPLPESLRRLGLTLGLSPRLLPAGEGEAEPPAPSERRIS